MLPLKAIVLALAPLGVHAGHCKPTQATSTSEPPTTTSTAPCPAYTLIRPSPEGVVCGKEVGRGNFQSSGYYLGFPNSSSLEACAKLCADRESCLSFYIEMYRPAPGAPAFPICALFSTENEEDLQFGAGTPGGPAFYELRCFGCDRG
ncbi:hypothetical protein ACJ41O_014815 [Fusarium nematophilum]